MKIRGSALLGYFKYIKKTWGEDGLNECMTATHLDPKQLVEGQWYDDALGSKIMKWLVDTKGPQYLEKLGYNTVKDLGLISYIIRFTNVKSLIKRMPESYRDAFNYGWLKVEIREKDAIVRIKDNATDDYACPAWIGVLRGMMEATNTKGKVTERLCQRKGGPYCEFVLEWQ